MNARELIEQIRKRGGRVLRMKEPPSVFVLTDSEPLVDWLFGRGATPVVTAEPYKRARGGSVEWDVWIHPVPVLGDETLWEASAR